MSSKQLVLAVFPDEAAADRGIEALKSWDTLNKDLDFEAIGVLALDENGKFKQRKMGRHRTGTGAGIGFVLGTIAAVTNPVGWGILGFTAVGAIVGAIAQKNLGLSKDDIARLSTELKGGKAAVGVMVPPTLAAAVSKRLADFGGTPETHTVVEDEMTDAAAADAEAADSDGLGVLGVPIGAPSPNALED